MNKNRKGFTLIELLIVVAIIGIIVAIAIPNLLNAIQRAKQRRTMGDMRTIATAIESYSVDMNRYPVAAGYAWPGGLTLGTTSLGNACKNYLSPTYLRQVPLVDGWSSYFIYNVSSVGSDYALGSPGKDGSFASAVTGGPTTDFNSDIIYVDGQFIQYPEGVQQ